MKIIFQNFFLSFSECQCRGRTTKEHHSSHIPAHLQHCDRSCQCHFWKSRHQCQDDARPGHAPGHPVQLAAAAAAADANSVTDAATETAK